MAVTNADKRIAEALNAQIQNAPAAIDDRKALAERWAHNVELAQKSKQPQKVIVKGQSNALRFQRSATRAKDAADIAEVYLRLMAEESAAPVAEA